MTKTKDKAPRLKETKEPKGKSNLVGRVKKVIKKSRRKLSEEKFEKELQRTIEFLAQLRMKLDNSRVAREGDSASAKVEKKPAPKAGKRVEKKVEKKVAGNASKKSKPSKKSAKKLAGNGVDKKRKGAAPRIGDAVAAAESVIALQGEAPSTKR